MWSSPARFSCEITPGRRPSDDSASIANPKPNERRIAIPRYRRLDVRARCELLAATYLDACLDGRDEKGDKPHGKPGSRLLVRYGFWREGSYRELERALDELRIHRNDQYRCAWRVYVLRCERLEALSGVKAGLARQGLTFVTESVYRQTRGNIYVPRDVAENAGYDSGQVEAALRPRRRAA